MESHEIVLVNLGNRNHAYAEWSSGAEYNTRGTSGTVMRADRFIGDVGLNLYSSAICDATRHIIRQRGFKTSDI